MFVNGWQLCMSPPDAVVTKQREAMNRLSAAIGEPAPLRHRIVVQPANLAALLRTPPVCPGAQVNYDPSITVKPHGALSVWVQLTGTGSVVFDVGSTRSKTFLSLNARAEVWDDMDYMAAMMVPGHATYHNALLPHRQHAATVACNRDPHPLWHFFLEAVYAWPDGPPIDLKHYNGAGFDYASLAAANCAQYARRKRRKQL